MKRETLIITNVARYSGLHCVSQKIPILSLSCLLAGSKKASMRMMQEVRIFLIKKNKIKN
jgi:hypothetical protein